ncbi:MAG: hypothetical protein ABFS34_16470 [Gemmatimonadota bacterium]
MIRSTGGSTGPVLTAHFVNNSGGAARILTGALSLEPLDRDDLTPEQQVRLDDIVAAASSGKPVPAPQGRDFPGGGTDWGPDADVVTVVLDGYCLEFAKDVPEEGALFRLVDREAQQEAARFREIVSASRRLQDEGELHPDGDPEAYFHSTRQWAAWTDELGLDRDGFEEAFVEHAKKNFDAAGRRWTASIEEQVRDLVPNRWADVTAVLDEADRSLGGQR